MSHRFQVYGLSVRSDHPIPGLAPLPDSPSTAAVDLTVDWGTSGPDAAAHGWRLLFSSDALDDEGRPLFVLERSAPGAPAEGVVFRLVYGDGTTFWIRPAGADSGPDRVWATWPAPLTSEDASTYFLGPVLGYLLRMRGQIVLHASAVGLVPATTPTDTVGTARGGAVAMVGPPGAGKSTTAAAFARRGHPVLTEDACALRDPDTPGDAFVALPGYPLVRLWSDSVEILYGAPDALPLLTPTWDKRYLPLGGDAAFSPRPLPLRAILLLEEREAAEHAPRVEPLAPAEAFIQLVANTYRNLVLSREERAEEFRSLHRLLRVTPVYRIFPHVDPARLDALLDLILETAALTPPPPS